jgi:hypothetical protein
MRVSSASLALSTARRAIARDGIEQTVVHDKQNVGALRR